MAQLFLSHRLYDGKVRLEATVKRWDKKSCDIGQPVTLYRYAIGR